MTDARTVHHVAPDRAGAFATPAEAVAKAVSGDVIHIHPGKYTGSFSIDKDLEIAGIGSHEDIVLTTDRDSVILCAATTVVLKNLSLVGKVRTQPVLHITSGNCDVTFCSIEGGKYGIAADSSSRITVANSSIADCERGALFAKEARIVHLDNSLIERIGGSGVITEGCQEVRVLHSTFSDTTPHAIESTGNGIFEVVDTEFTAVSHAQILDNYKPIKFENEERSWYARKLVGDSDA
ncbi:MAG: right-handed parallel beta-helix repeat-containing protein [bacterium]|nr:right-handed parallel beta-helix repeat-containing protein [bacterium]MBK8127490.1 right-handed parallel beta-helix repeat-containing protein [bacterium]